MLNIDSRRVNDPTAISPEELLEASKKYGKLVVQFSATEAYNPTILDSLNEACRLMQDRLQVRFYGHYRSTFDAGILRHLPDVRDLAVDCLTKIVNEDKIGELRNLKRLSFGVFEFDRPDFLKMIDLEKLENLILIENRKRNIDLAPLAQCRSLNELFINGHSKGIASISTLPSLQKLRLSAFAKAHSLEFIARILKLRDLTFILGGRSDMDDLSSATLEMLQIVRVRGLSTLGDLSRFPSLSALRVEDQLQLLRLNLAGASLERLWIHNCKKLSELPGLEMQSRLREFRASVVALNMNALRDWDWPQTARSISLFSGSKKWNDHARAMLSKRGLGEKGDLWP